jgi:hypothetical protein
MGLVKIQKRRSLMGAAPISETTSGADYFFFSFFVTGTKGSMAVTFGL